MSEEQEDFEVAGIQTPDVEQLYVTAVLTDDSFDTRY